MIKKNEICRDCGSERLHFFLDLNDQPPANAFIKKENIGSETYYTLKAYVCEDCNLVQLIDVVDLDELFQDYVYFTAGAGATTPKHFNDYANDMVSRFSLTDSSRVLEIGSNDGLLLKAFQEAGITSVLGVDPAHNVAVVANENGVETIAKPWSAALARELANQKGKIDLMIGNNVVAHIDDHRDLFTGVKEILAPDGVFVFEAPYLLDMFDNLSFDTIYHEHLNCLSLRPIKRLVEELGMEVIDMQTTAVQGVSMRVFISLKGSHEVNKKVDEFIAREIEYGCNKVSTYDELAAKIAERKSEVVNLLNQLKGEGKVIAGYGAPAKGNTLLNYMQIGPEILEYLTEELPLKVGKYSPGMNIPVINISDARQNPPDYFLVLAWNYLDSILDKETKLIEKGVKFIVPIGKEVKII